MVSLRAIIQQNNHLLINLNPDPGGDLHNLHNQNDPDIIYTIRNQRIMEKMMTHKQIPVEQFMIRPMHLWDVQSLLLTSGDLGSHQFNAMTIGWGSIGYIWRRPFIQVVVRPTRYTYQFMEKYDSFTVCAFPHKYQTYFLRLTLIIYQLNKESQPVHLIL